MGFQWISLLNTLPCLKIGENSGWHRELPNFASHLLKNLLRLSIGKAVNSHQCSAEVGNERCVDTPVFGKTLLLNGVWHPRQPGQRVLHECSLGLQVMGMERRPHSMGIHGTSSQFLFNLWAYHMSCGNPAALTLNLDGTKHSRSTRWPKAETAFWPNMWWLFSLRQSFKGPVVNPYNPLHNLNGIRSIQLNLSTNIILWAV